MSTATQANRPRRVINRLPVNPQDKSTVVSILPKIINEYKPTIFPSRFIIPAAKLDDFEILVIEPASWYLANVNEGMAPTEIQVNSAQLAKSIVTDYCNGIFLCNMRDIMPGLFWVLGAHNRISVLTSTDEHGKTFQELIKEEREKQKRWYMANVQVADSLWARSNGNPLAISDDARLAAEVLQLKDKPWMQDQQTVQMVNCRACGELINKSFPVCKHCHAIVDTAKAKELNIEFAKG